ncbi:helix-turn-helix domain-containing protein [Parabacteroides sp. PF5-6]|uniref:AraC family transcriptional regulator n=1 Tax=Parabacteroides sp. PF5-6 TaxID=1742403 RepID=UPI0024068E73|nr:helix-turn-helix domain-containing protein [Parabacteroides sp. PF5-6]MDF9831078.1 AraC-like DNA-binding protein/antibiotic biosynthesis monooxygenase (ABM) superfamily enzyme [Parabacteroides sp. PF5-6]
MNETVFYTLLHGMNGVDIGVCGLSAFLLLRQSEGVRSRRVLAVMMLLWGIVYLNMLLQTLIYPLESRGVMPPYTLIGGTFVVIITTFYVIEVVRNGWLTPKHIFYWFTPFLVVVAFYYMVLGVTGEVETRLPDLRAFGSYLFQFNVWYRLVLLFTCLAYLGIMFVLFRRYAPSYRRWLEDHYSSTENMDIAWIRYYNFGLLCMTLIYFYALATGDRNAYLVHFAITIVFFSYITGKGLFHVDPYPEGYFRETMNDRLAEEADLLREETEELVFSSSESFAPKLEEYKSRFEEWMQTEKPYLQPEFKRSDLAEILPMNRTYLSRLFSEGYAMSFSQVVRRYRVEEAKRLIEEKPQLTLKQLYPLCGFSSDIVFHRTFTEVTGMTPKQFKETIPPPTQTAPRNVPPVA